jgi:hypothetical protein
MNNRRWIALGMVLCCATSVPLLAADLPPLLTMDEVKKLVDAGQYQDALKAIARIAELKGAAAAGYNRHEVLMLRAECQLQTRQTTAARDTLELARKEAAANLDEEKAAQASALKQLIEKSPGFNYTPRTGNTRKPIPILDRILRKSAYDALFADELAPLQLKAKAAANSKSLVPIHDASKMLASVRAVERVSTGNNKQTEQITADLTKQSLKLLNDALDDLSTKTQRISDSANRVVTENVSFTDANGRTFMQQQTHRKGLGPQDGPTLKAIKADCDKIPAAAAELAQALSADAGPFKSIAVKADTIKDKANTVLTDDYSSAIR